MSKSNAIIVSVLALGMASTGCRPAPHEEPDSVELELLLGGPLPERPDKGREVARGRLHTFDAPRQLLIRTPQGKEIRSYSRHTMVETTGGLVYQVQFLPLTKPVSSREAAEAMRPFFEHYPPERRKRLCARLDASAPPERGTDAYTTGGDVEDGVWMSVRMRGRSEVRPEWYLSVTVTLERKDREGAEDVEP